MTWFKIETVHVPVSNKDNNRSYTKVLIDTDYIRVFENNSIELSQENLDLCYPVEATYVCSDTMLQIHRSKITCATAIYWDSPSSVINEACRIQFFHNFTPVVTILDAGKNMLLANIDTPRTVNCIDQSVPRHHNGHSYTIINRSTLCGCFIATPSHSIAPKLSGCNNSHIQTLELEVAINAAVYSIMSRNNTMPIIRYTVQYLTSRYQTST